MSLATAGPYVKEVNLIMGGTVSSGKRNRLFVQGVKRWSDNAASGKFPHWEEQLRMLSDMSDLITPELSLEEVISTIYSSVNQLMDAYQFSVGLYDPENMTITFRGIIENNQAIPDAVIDASLPDRLAPWCIRNGKEIFINDMEKEYKKYLPVIPTPATGVSPMAALYVPLRLNDEVVGLITVRTINRNVYKRHHLYLLKTLGDFVIRTLELAKERTKGLLPIQQGEKSWRWCPPEKLPRRSRKLLDELSPREREVLELLASGLSNKAMAEKLFVSPGTVKTHTLRLYQKMDVPNRTAAIMKAVELNWFI